MSDANISLVQDLYAAFARGDVSTILSACAPDVDWRLVGRKDDYPTFGAWQGPGEVEKFFQLVSDLEESRISRRGNSTARATRCLCSASIRCAVSNPKCNSAA
jgi:ketosteroid isomerase-like protein